MDIEALLDDLLAREGGYVDHPADRGGPTNWGVTENVARAHGFTGAMRDLPRDAARAIYRERYWTGPGFERIADIAPRLAAELFDTGVNMGPAVAIGFLQRSLNALNRGGSDWSDIAVDRRIGPKTLAALRTFLKLRGPSAEAVLVKAVNALQGARYIDLAEHRPANEAFAFGWLKHRV